MAANDTLAGMSGAEDGFDAAARVFVDAARTGSDVSVSIIRVLRTTLGRVISGRGVRPPDVEDVTANVIMRCWRSATEGRIQAETAGRYLLRSAANAASDYRRRERVRDGAVGSTVEPPDDAVAQLMNSSWSADLVQRAMGVAYRERDLTVVRVVTAWLDAAERGGVPSHKDVASAAGVSPPTVRSCLRRFARYVTSVTDFPMAGSDAST